MYSDLLYRNIDLGWEVTAHCLQYMLPGMCKLYGEMLLNDCLSI